MRAQVAQYLNEIVSLTILGLMGLALVSGQASSATVVDAQEAFGERLVENVGEHLDLKLEISFRHEGE